MSLFRNVFGFLTGNTNELAKPVFSKPYVDKTYDMLELALRLDQAPEESKSIFRGAMESLAAKIKVHQTVSDLLSQSGFPILIMYDLHLLTSFGSAAIDFVVLSNRFIAAISCPSQNDTLTAEESRAISAPGERRIQSSSEHSAYILAELLKEEQLISKKNLQMIWPVTISAGTSGDSAFSDPLESFPSTQSQAYPEVHRNLVIPQEDLINQIKQLFRMDDAFCWITNKDIFAISKALLKYEELSSGSCGAPKG